MFIEFSTTINHKIIIGDNGIEGVEHAVQIDAGEAAHILNSDNIMIVVGAGLEAALKATKTRKPTILVEEDEN